MKLTQDDKYEISKNGDPPQHLYHYTTAEKFINLILPKMQLKFSKLSATNDPVEYKKKSIFPQNPELTRHALFLANYLLNLLINEYVGVACFFMDVAEPDFPALFRSRMWSQYGDGHQGLVLRFDSQQLITTVETAIGKPQSVFKNAINYLPWDENKLSTAIWWAPGPLDLNNLEEKMVDFIHSNEQDLFFNKNDDYSDESEFRICWYDPARKAEFVDIGSSLNGIYLGDKIKLEHQETIVSFANTQKITCERVAWLDGRPRTTSISTDDIPS